MKHYDILGNELEVGNFIATTDSSSYKGLHMYLIMKLTPKGVGVAPLGDDSRRTNILYTEQYCIKLSQQEGEKYISLRREYFQYCIDCHKNKKNQLEYNSWFEQKLNKND